MPLLNELTSKLREAFENLLVPIGKDVDKVQGKVEGARDDHAKSKKKLRRLMSSRRRLMGMGEPPALEAEDDFTSEEMDQLLDDMVAHAVTTAAVRKGVDVRDHDGNSARRRQLMDGVELDDGLLGALHLATQRMFEWTHDSVIAGAHARMPAMVPQPPSTRRRLQERGGPHDEAQGTGLGGLDWSALLPLKEFKAVTKVSPATSDHARTLLFVALP